MSHPMHRRSMLFAAILVVGCGTADSHDHAAQSPAGQNPAVQAPATQAAADAAGVNKVLDPAGFSDPRVRAAYEAAKQYARVLEEIYCYCRCKENIGHRALIECYESDHAAQCDVCMNEAMIAAKMTRDGRTPKEIQKAIDVLYAG